MIVCIPPIVLPPMCCVPQSPCGYGGGYGQGGYY